MAVSFSESTIRDVHTYYRNLLYRNLHNIRNCEVQSRLLEVEDRRPYGNYKSANHRSHYYLP